MKTKLLLCAAISTLTGGPVARAIVIAQVDNFQDGTLMNWSGGSSPTNISTGGPAGTGDRYLRINSAGGSLGTFNASQWSGDYSAAGVTGVSAALRNQGVTALQVRIMLVSSAGGNFTSTTAISLPADNLWHPATFLLNAANLTDVSGGGGDLSTTLANVERILIRHQSGTPLGAGSSTPVTGTLGLDNITAVPEPVSFALIAAGILLMTHGRRRAC